MRVSDAGRRPIRRAAAFVLAAVALLSVVAAGTAAGGAATDHASAGPFAGQDGGGGDGLVICDRDAVEFVDAFNGGTEEVPAFFRGRISDSAVHLDVEGEGGGDYTMVTDEESRVTDTSEGEPDSPSVRVVTDCGTFRNITDASDPGERFRTAYENDRIDIVGVEATDRVVFRLAETATNPAELVVLLLVLLALLLLALIVAYVFARRLGAYYRGDDADDEGGDGGGDGDADPGGGDAPHDGGG